MGEVGCTLVLRVITLIEERPEVVGNGADVLFPIGRVFCCDGKAEVDVGVFCVVIHIDDLAICSSPIAFYLIRIMAHLGEIVARREEEDSRREEAEAYLIIYIAFHNVRILS